MKFEDERAAKTEYLLSNCPTGIPPQTRPHLVAQTCLLHHSNVQVIAHVGQGVLVEAQGKVPSITYLTNTLCSVEPQETLQYA